MMPALPLGRRRWQRRCGCLPRGPHFQSLGAFSVVSGFQGVLGYGALGLGFRVYRFREEHLLFQQAWVVSSAVKHLESRHAPGSRGPRATKPSSR